MLPKLRVLVVGGLDPAGRAGLLVDVKTLNDFGVAPLAVASCLTAQGRNPRVEPVRAAMLKAQLQAAEQSGPIHAVKLGVIPNRAALSVLEHWLRTYRGPLVVDPLTKSSSGVRLSQLHPIDFQRLESSRTIWTPNETEYISLAPHGVFHQMVVKSVKPGCDGLYVEGELVQLLSSKVLPRTANHRGTGCRFASSLAACVAKGHSFTQAAENARRYVRKFLSTSIM